MILMDFPGRSEVRSWRKTGRQLKDRHHRQNQQEIKRRSWKQLVWTELSGSVWHHLGPAPTALLWSKRTKTLCSDWADASLCGSCKFIINDDFSHDEFNVSADVFITGSGPFPPGSSLCRCCCGHFLDICPDLGQNRALYELIMV